MLAADVLEHVRQPEPLLDQIAALLAPGGSFVASVPNFGHWYPRAAGRARPVRLRPAGHPRPRPRALLHPAQLRAAGRHGAGFRVARRTGTGLPLEVVDRGGERHRRRLRAARHRASPGSTGPRCGVRPQLFAYQFLYELRPAPSVP